MGVINTFSDHGVLPSSKYIVFVDLKLRRSHSIDYADSYQRVCLRDLSRIPRSILLSLSPTPAITASCYNVPFQVLSNRNMAAMQWRSLIVVRFCHPFSDFLSLP
jgi:hypothetical protein